MKSSEENSLDSVLQAKLTSIQELAEDAQVAEESITLYLRQRFAEVLAHEYAKKSEKDEDETAVHKWAESVALKSRLTARQMYLFFGYHLDDNLDEFWEQFNLSPSETAERPSSMAAVLEGITGRFKGIAQHEPK